MCLSLMLGCLRPAFADGGTPRILRFDPNVIQVDTVRFDGGPVKVRFVCENIADKPVTILDVHAQCGCTTPVFPRTPVKPGEKAVVEVTLHPENLFGEQKRHLTVVATNGDYRKFNTLTVLAYVKRDQSEAEIRFPASLGEGLRTELAKVSLRRRKAGDTVKRTLVLYNDSDKPMQLSWKKGRRMDGSLSVSTLEPGARATLELVYKTRWMRSGEFTDRVQLYVNGRAVTPIELEGTIE